MNPGSRGFNISEISKFQAQLMIISVDEKGIEAFKCEYVCLHLFQLINLKLKYFIPLDRVRKIFSSSPIVAKVVEPNRTLPLDDVIPQSTFEQIEREQSWAGRSLEVLYQILKTQRQNRTLCLELFRLHCQPRLGS